MRWLLVAAFLAAAGPAVADPASDAPPPPSQSEAHPVAIAVNPPFRWAGGAVIGLSAYVALTPHQVVRVNFATYEAGQGFGDVLAGAAGAESFPNGTTMDVGAGWSYFPRRAFDGFWVEAGVLRRQVSTSQYDMFAEDDWVYYDTTTVAARGLVGWSWLGWDKVFLSTGVGLSAGYRSGEKRTEHDDPLDSRPMTYDVSEADIGVEWMMRIGGVFGL